ncbi:MAG TPA: hypothetical protein VN783_13960 [Thermoanaerobaculia bacterium]|nr:hypothetical protein [Thermoanaerobaculia bacterium]
MPPIPPFVICIANEGAEDLQILKVYRRLGDDDAEAKGFLRVIDDSGEDYLYPRSAFAVLPLPAALEEKLSGLAVAQLQH